MPRRSGRLPVLLFHTMSREALIFPDTVYRAGAKHVPGLEAQHKFNRDAASLGQDLYYHPDDELAPPTLVK
jgi:hypothetical protein